jgi:hypothetical protein
MAMKYLADVPDDEVNKITHLNAMREFRFDPFAVRPRETCTVGALRAEAGDVDLGLMSRSAPDGKVRPKGTTASALGAIGEKNPDG